MTRARSPVTARRTCFAAALRCKAEAASCALLFFDITEKEKTEALRREFTANVSHELKTPLQSISGCAELLENGMVRAEDIRPFAGRIHAEARRIRGGGVDADDFALPVQQDHALAHAAHNGIQRILLSLNYGESLRDSATLMLRSLYAAQRLADGTVLRRCACCTLVK